jgi:hypothetical protein
MALKGNIESFYFNSILQLLKDEQKTGILRVNNDDKEIRVYFQDGNIIYATGSQKEDRIGYLLLSKKLISKEQLQQCLIKAQREKIALGKILVEEGHISIEDLKEIIYEQTQEIIFDLFVWEKGEFEYNDAKFNLEGMIITKISVVKLLLEASRRIDEMSVFRKQIPDDNIVFRASGDVQDKAESKLNTDEYRVMKLIDGTHSVKQICNASKLGDFELYKALYSLLTSGHIERSDPTDEHERVERPFESIISVYDDVLQTICQLLKAEVGQQMFSIIKDSKPEIEPGMENILQDFHPDNSLATNIIDISKAMTPDVSHQEGSAIIIKNFNAFILNIFERTQDLLGIQLTGNLLQEVDRTLNYVNTDQSESIEENRIITEIKKILLLAETKLGDKIKRSRSKGGLFAKLKKG